MPPKKLSLYSVFYAAPSMPPPFHYAALLIFPIKWPCGRGHGGPCGDGQEAAQGGGHGHVHGAWCTQNFLVYFT